MKMLVATITIGCLIATLRNSTLISQGNEKIQNKQIHSLSRTMIRQAALAAADSIIAEDQEALLTLAHDWAKESLILDATIYDVEGVKLASSEGAVSVNQIVGLNTPLSVASIGRQQLIEPVLDGGNMIGFIRLTLEKSKLTAYADHHYRKSDRLMYSMLLMTFIAGIGVAVLFRRKEKTPPVTLMLGGNKS